MCRQVRCIEKDKNQPGRVGRGRGTHSIITLPAGNDREREREREKLNKSKLAKVEENWVSRYKTLVPQLFTDISFRCLGVAATVHAPSFLPTCLPLAACQTDRFGLDTEKSSLRKTGRRAAALSTEIIMKKIETN